ncbi:MAG: hypothetical protein ACRCU0_00195 [Candidatus Rhabdochlamydia sp.]
MTNSTNSINSNTYYEYTSAPDGYDLNAVIKKVKDSFSKGKKVAVFIGRTHSEDLPEEAGVVWFSLDLRNPKPSKGEERKMDFHLHINFEDEEKLSKIEKCFDKVVVDRETYKFFVGYYKEPVPKDTFLLEGKFKVPKENYKISKGSRDIDIKEYHGKITKKLINLLNQTGEEELICDFAPRKELRAGNLICRAIGYYDVEKVKEEHSWYKHIENLETQVMLEEIFEDVSYVIDKPFPYYNIITCHSGERTYFIAKNLKAQKSLHWRILKAIMDT